MCERAYLVFLFRIYFFYTYLCYRLPRPLHVAFPQQPSFPSHRGRQHLKKFSCSVLFEVFPDHQRPNFIMENMDNLAEIYYYFNYNRCLSDVGTHTHGHMGVAPLEMFEVCALTGLFVFYIPASIFLFAFQNPHDIVRSIGFSYFRLSVLIPECQLLRLLQPLEYVCKRQMNVVNKFQYFLK